MNKTILIVEDEQHFHDLYEAMLEGTDYRIISAYDGDEALSKLEEEKPDLIILDMLLDMITGDTFILYLKSMPEYEDTPVVIISAFSKKYYKNLKKTAPNLVFIDKLYLTKERLIDEVKKICVTLVLIQA
ncbi:MAG: response regulator [Deltaproteobacteria bacterium]|nr:response regulator [Deltaproteobacteria bacterium]